MQEHKANAKMVTSLMMRLLPIQILFAAVGTVNGIVSSYFAANFVGIDAMGAVGLYGPLNLIISACSTILLGGSAFLCGKYMGQNEQHKVNNIFTLDVVLSVFLSLVIIIVLLFLAAFDLTFIFTKDISVRAIFNTYILGQAIGIIPFILGNQLTVFLSLENRQRVSVVASISFIIVNLILNYIFVRVLHMEAFGLALASSLGMWVFCLLEASHFAFGASYMKFNMREFDLDELKDIILIGIPSAEESAFHSVRGFIINGLLTTYVGSIGISAFAAVNNLLTVFMAIPAGMIAVSRLLISVAIGEDDRQTLTDIMRGMFRRYIPIMCGISVFIIVLAEPFASLFYKDPADPVYMMTVWGFRIVPLSMPFSLIIMHFICYVHAVDRHVILHILNVLDGFLCVSLFTVLLIKSLGMNSVYIAYVLSGVVTTFVICVYPLVVKGTIPRHLEEFLAMPDEFGTSSHDRMDISLKKMEDVPLVAEKIQNFCRGRGVDKKRSYIAGLSMEEMAGNVVRHGFTNDKRQHSVDVRVVHKNDDIILRIKDDCVAFDPRERQFLAEDEDITKNIGIRMVFKIAEEVKYQNLLGINVLTVRI